MKMDEKYVSVKQFWHNKYRMAATILCFFILWTPLQADIHVLNVDLERSPLSITNSKFLSVALGSSIIADNFLNFDMKSPRLHKLMSALSPGYLRIGGTAANRLTFVPKKRSDILESDAEIDCPYDGRNCKALQEGFTMTGEQWLDINRLASTTGFQVLFDVNHIHRLQDDSWDSSNAEKLIEFSNKNNLSVIWELGNEPTLYKNHFNYEISPSQLAKDFIKFRSILNQYPRYKNALLVGPDMSQPRLTNVKLFKYLEEFLQNGGGNTVNAVTWHQYNLNGNNARYTDFLNPEVFNELKLQIIKIQEVLKNAGFAKKSSWLGETASAYGGGAPGISDRFIATFLWLDKLGMAARYGLDIVIRQTLFKSNYALIDNTLNPVPDWWISAIYKRLVGPKVISCNSESSKVVRLYCHCTKKHVLDANTTSITVFGMNLKNTEVRVHIRGIPAVPEKIYSYILTGDLDLLSNSIVLNNEVLTLLPNNDVPQFKPKVLKAPPYLILPPYSLVFWIIPSPSFDLCSN